MRADIARSCQRRKEVFDDMAFSRHLPHVYRAHVIYLSARKVSRRQLKSAADIAASGSFNVPPFLQHAGHRLDADMPVVLHPASVRIRNQHLMNVTDKGLLVQPNPLIEQILTTCTHHVQGWRFPGDTPRAVLEDSFRSCSVTQSSHLLRRAWQHASLLRGVSAQKFVA